MFNLLKESLQNKNSSEDDPEEGTKDLVDTLLKKLASFYSKQRLATAVIQ